MFYLKKEVLFLSSDVFRNYTGNCEKASGINPLYSYSTPSFTPKVSGV